MLSATQSKKLCGSVDAAFDEMVDVRRQLHRRPELSFQEHSTTALIRERLGVLGLAQEACPTETGAVFRLPAGGSTSQASKGPVLLRADIDALPVHEETGLPYASEIAGLMHACGHDAHVAALLGSARSLANIADDLERDVVFLFQPAEEVIGGAAAMIRGGVLDRVRPHVVLGCHVTSLAPAGMVLTRPGIAMAGVLAIRASVTGPGGHGANEPRRGNAVLAAAHLASSMEEATSGMGLEGTNCVCSPGAVRGGTASNIVPRTAEVLGTLRTFGADQESQAVSRLNALVDRLTAEFDVDVQIELVAGTGPVRNDPSVTASMVNCARELFGDERVFDMPAPAAASDDIAEFLALVPGCYCVIGAALPDGRSGPHHSPTFAIDESALSSAATTLAATAATIACG